MRCLLVTEYPTHSHFELVTIRHVYPDGMYLVQSVDGPIYCVVEDRLIVL